MGEIRQHGMILAIEMVQIAARSAPPMPGRSGAGCAVYRHALEAGVLLRPIGNVVYFMPPYVIDEDQIDAHGAHRHCGHRARGRD